MKIINIYKKYTFFKIYLQSDISNNTNFLFFNTFYYLILYLFYCYIIFKYSLNDLYFKITFKC